MKDIAAGHRRRRAGEPDRRLGDAVLHRRRRRDAVASCGRATAPPAAPSRSPTSTRPVAARRQQPGRPHGRGRDAVLPGQRGHREHRALEERRHRRRDQDGEGHQPDGPELPARVDQPGGRAPLPGQPSSSDAELWRSDGTESGTRLVKDINPGGNSFPDRLFGNSGAVYFAADDGTHGAELWRSDGTEAGTVLIGDLRPGPAGSAPADVVVVADGAIVFTADDGTHGDELVARPRHGPAGDVDHRRSRRRRDDRRPVRDVRLRVERAPRHVRVPPRRRGVRRLHEPADDRRAPRTAGTRSPCVRATRSGTRTPARHAHLRRQPPRPVAAPPPGRRPRAARAGRHACAAGSCCAAARRQTGRRGITDHGRVRRGLRPPRHGRDRIRPAGAPAACAWSGSAPCARGASPPAGGSG